jgi:hypothetical protein
MIDLAVLIHCGYCDERLPIVFYDGAFSLLRRNQVSRALASAGWHFVGDKPTCEPCYGGLRLTATRRTAAMLATAHLSFEKHRQIVVSR